MKTATEYISESQIVLLRLALGFFPVAVYAWIKGALKLSHLKHIGHFLVMSLIGTVVYYYGFVKGAMLLYSGVVGSLSGLTPIFSYLLAFILIADEKANVYKVLGIMCGFVGVVTIANPFAADLSTTNLEGVLYTIAGSFGIGASFVYVKKFMLPLNIPASALITYQLGLGVLILLPVTDMNGIGNIWNDVYAATGLFVGLGILGTGLAYIIYYYIIENWAQFPHRQLPISRQSLHWLLVQRLSEKKSQCRNTLEPH